MLFLPGSVSNFFPAKAESQGTKSCQTHTRSLQRALAQQPRSPPWVPGTAPTTATHTALLAQALGPRGSRWSRRLGCRPSPPRLERSRRPLPPRGWRQADEPRCTRGHPLLGKVEVARETRRAERAAAASPAPPPRPGLLSRHAAPSAGRPPLRSRPGPEPRPRARQEVPPPCYVIGAAHRPRARAVGEGSGRATVARAAAATVGKVRTPLWDVPVGRTKAREPGERQISPHARLPVS